jgi:hypothetical protein
MCAYMMQLDDDNIFQAVQRLSYSHSANCASQAISLNEPLNFRHENTPRALGPRRRDASASTQPPPCRKCRGHNFATQHAPQINDGLFKGVSNHSLAVGFIKQLVRRDCWFERFERSFKHFATKSSYTFTLKEATQTKSFTVLSQICFLVPPVKIPINPPMLFGKTARPRDQKVTQVQENLQQRH